MNSKIGKNLALLGGSIKDWLVDAFCLQKWPDDKAECRRIHRGILAACGGSSMKPGPNGKIRIETETKDGK